MTRYYLDRRARLRRGQRASRARSLQQQAVVDVGEAKDGDWLSNLGQARVFPSLILAMYSFVQPA